MRTEKLFFFSSRFPSLTTEKLFQRFNLSLARNYTVMMNLVMILTLGMNIVALLQKFGISSELVQVGLLPRIFISGISFVTLFMLRRASLKRVYIINLILFSMAAIVLALRMTTPVDSDVGSSDTFTLLFHVTMDGITLFLFVYIAQILLLPFGLLVFSSLAVLYGSLYMLLLVQSNLFQVRHLSLAFTIFIIGFALGNTFQKLRRFYFKTLLELRRRNVQLRILANTDPLTRLKNRRSFYENAEREYDRCRRYNNKMSVLVFDLDHFKKVNDSYGHEAGDIVLYNISQFVRGKLRNCDTIGRLGGEEFAILLPETNIDQAMILGQRLLEQTAALPVQYGKDTINQTLSIGIAMYRQGDDSFDELMKRADQALYRAKNNGRNRMESIH
jgi:diguanylate cyclase (GGDEF)-like protein